MKDEFWWERKRSAKTKLDLSVLLRRTGNFVGHHKALEYCRSSGVDF